MSHAMNDMVPFSDEQIALAASNYEAQEALLDQLRRALSSRGMSVEQLAAELELPEEDAQDWIDGEVDLTLSELRQLANAVDVRLSYSVSPIATVWRERFAEIAETLPWKDTDKAGLWNDHRVPVEAS